MREAILHHWPRFPCNELQSQSPLGKYFSPTIPRPSGLENCSIFQPKVRPKIELRDCPQQFILACTTISPANVQRSRTPVPLQLSQSMHTRKKKVITKKKRYPFRVFSKIIKINLCHRMIPLEFFHFFSNLISVTCVWGLSKRT